MPSGKILWLCPEHQKLPRVLVLSTEKLSQEESDQESQTSPEYELLEELRAIVSDGKAS